jgi:uncharacterized protein YecT (DUF1311 family)
MNKVIPALLLSLIFFPAISSAQNALQVCEKESQELEKLSACYDILIERKNRDLQTWVNNQEFLLQEVEKNTGRDGALKVFKRGHKNFIRFREDNCRMYYLSKMPAPEASTDYKRCLIITTQQRIDELMEFSLNY